MLTALSAFWFRWLYEFEDILPNHFITTDLSQYPAACRLHHHILDGRSMLVQKASPLPVECIVRGYLSGSGWSDYQRTGAISGQPLPKGLQESQQLLLHFDNSNHALHSPSNLLDEQIERL